MGHCVNLALWQTMPSVVVHVTILHTKILLPQQLLASHALIAILELDVENVLTKILVPNVYRKLTCSWKAVVLKNVIHAVEFILDAQNAVTTNARNAQPAII